MPIWPESQNNINDKFSTSPSPSLSSNNANIDKEEGIKVYKY